MKNFSIWQWKWAFYFITLSQALNSAVCRGEDSPGQSLENLKLGSHWIYIGMDLGPMWLTTAPTGESKKNGYQLGIKGVVSRYWQDYVADAGLGWFFNRLSSTDEMNPLNLTTTALFLDASGRYRVNPEVQVGPALNLLVGNSNVGFAQTSSTDSSVALLGGVRGFYELPLDPTVLRLGGEVMTDLTISNRQLYWMLFNVQIGLPAGF